MLDRLFGICFAMLAAAVAVYVAVRLIESVAGPLVVIMAVLGGFVLVGFLVRLLWRRQRMDRW